MSASQSFLRRSYHTARFRFRRRSLVRSLTACASNGERFDLTARLIPGGAHQVREEIVGFLDVVSEFAPERICEIGMADGGTTLLLANASPATRLVIGIDPRPRHGAQLGYYAPPVQQVAGLSHQPETLARVRELLAGKELDLLFIDGDHSYDGVVRDLELYGPLVRPGGLIGFHDIVEDFRTRHGVQTDFDAGEVPRLWSELRGRRGAREFVRDPDQDGFGIGVIESQTIAGGADA